MLKTPNQIIQVTHEVFEVWDEITEGLSWDWVAKGLMNKNIIYNCQPGFIDFFKN